jgi:hypothetical protein
LLDTLELTLKGIMPVVAKKAGQRVAAERVLAR